jgi:predicted glycosyltransferase
MYSDGELGRIRAKELLHLTELYRPRLVLVDHTPQGKHKELVPALTAGAGLDTIWVLGVRGVVGEVPQARSDLAAALFAEHYHTLLWYGDSTVLGPTHRQLLQHRYGTEPVECGYVLRLAEYAFWNNRLSVPGACPAGTIAIPWLGEESLRFLACLAAALKKIPASCGCWYLFIDTGSEPEAQQVIGELFREVVNCRIEPPGGNYVPTLLHSKTAVVYGGYNSIMDILHVRIPALVVYREMADEEQEMHLRRIVGVTGENVTMVSESRVSAEELEALLANNLGREKAPSYSIDTDGASQAARHLNRLLC